MNKKYFAIVILLFINLISNAQEESFYDNEVTFPHPSASNISAFVDVPVDYFTGTPDIGYHLMSLPLNSGGESINLSLKYHPRNISSFHSASEVGLGWSVLGSGIITRDVVNQPDEVRQQRTPYAPITPDTIIYNDIYYYDFQNYSGKFKFHREEDGTTKIINLSGSGFKIDYVNTSTTSRIKVDSFIITDNKGVKYIFEKKDYKKINQFGIHEYYYCSSHHLTKIISSNGEEIASFEYETLIDRHFSHPNAKTINKLKKITSPYFGSIEFNLITDLDLEPSRNDISEIHSLVLKDKSGAEIERCEFDYNYFYYQKPNVYYQNNIVRFLTKYQKVSSESPLKYQFSYDIKDYSNFTNLLHETDDLGYSSIVDNTSIDDILILYGLVNPETVTNGVLTEVLLPTGGKVEYEYEANTVNYFSFVDNVVSFEDESNKSFVETDFPGQNGNPYLLKTSEHSPEAELEVYASIPENNQLITVLDNSFNTTRTDYSRDFTIDSNEEIYIEFNGTPNPCEFCDPNSDPYISYQIKNSSGVIVDHVTEPFVLGYRFNMQIFRKYFLNSGTYTFHLLSGAGGSGRVIVRKKRLKDVLRKWDYKCGIRIKKISFYNHFGESEPNLTKSFEYNSFYDPLSSSGVFHFNRHFLVEPQKAKVVYKNVKEITNNNSGYTKYYYYSPSDMPVANGTGHDIMYLHNNILEKGLLNYYEVYDSEHRLLLKHKNYYNFLNFNEVSYYLNNNTHIEEFINKKYEVTKSYFYNPNSEIVQKKFTFYNSYGQVTNSGFLVDDTSFKETINYFPLSFPQDAICNELVAKNMLSFPIKRENFINTTLLGTQEISYKNWGNNLLAPEIIKSSKGNGDIENRTIIVQRDNVYAHPLEVKQENGIHICYIWGYNKTQPIAKIENATYAQVEQYVANLQTLSNGNNEQNLINALNNLRTALPNAMVTTYTYKPLIGISTVTDPKGDKQTYHYDSFNRLQYVKDKDGNILSENQYHYRTQN